VRPWLRGPAQSTTCPGACSIRKSCTWLGGRRPWWWGICAANRPTCRPTSISTNVVEEVLSELGSRVAAARTAGCGEVWADPALEFGKHLDHNLRLLKHLARLRSCLGVPIMVGVSRKRFIADLLHHGKPSKGSQTLRLPPATPSPLASLGSPRWSAAGDEGRAAKARGAGGVVVGPGNPRRGSRRASPREQSGPPF